ncbi:hypothetical protein KY284_035050 [Solanum tuberosum]|nr:hypothetical protein KY284_035050 [Solanum tuberosum]
MKRQNREASRSAAAVAISDCGSGGSSNGAKCKRNCGLRSSANCGVQRHTNSKQGVGARFPVTALLF